MLINVKQYCQKKINVKQNDIFLYLELKIKIIK